MKSIRKVLYGTAAGAAALSMMFSGFTWAEDFTPVPPAELDSESEGEDGKEKEEINVQDKVTKGLENAVKIDFKNGTIASADAQDPESGYSLADQVLEINDKGTYVLSGEFAGKIRVKAGKKDEVILVLAGLNVQNETGEALEIKKAKSVIIYTEVGTDNCLISGVKTEIVDNTLKDETDATAGTSQNAEDDDPAYEEDPSENASADEGAESGASGAAVTAKTDLILAGEGTLTVGGYINNGISAADDLTADSGSVIIEAVNNGIKCKKDITISGGSLSIISGNDGVKAERAAREEIPETVDETTGEVLTEAVEARDARGTIEIRGGSLNVESFGDGLQANVALEINGGEVNITTKGDIPESGDSFGGPGDSFGRQSSDDSSVSSKAVKSGGTLDITGGIIVIDSADDALHSADILTISGGTITLSSGDDGIHSDKQADITGGDIDILKSYEGIEANQINVSGGDIYLIASDDGFNANGGSSFGPPGSSGGNNSSTEMPNLNISGGNIYVNAAGDGLDSNGNITVTGGYTVVDGPENSANGALDSGMENGGKLTVNGGLIFAGGASGMAESFEESSAQNSFVVTLPVYYGKGAEIAVRDASGNVLFEHTAGSRGNSIVFSCPELKTDETYTLVISEYEMEITLTKTATAVKVSSDGTVTETTGGSFGGPGGGQAPQGMPGGGRPGGNQGNNSSEPVTRIQEAAEDAPQPGDMPEPPQPGKTQEGEAPAK
ncbi:MAG: carbohydrate-binding domain-containing protein [Parasporobacterium sp.]|nr:carbohydrate-binding domain-containing protein [Parasporobacterium sp.]